MADERVEAVDFEALAAEIEALKNRLPDNPVVVQRDKVEDEEVVICSDRAGLARIFLDVAEKACRKKSGEAGMIEWLVHNQSSLDLYVEVLPDGGQPSVPEVKETLWSKIWAGAMGLGCLAMVALFFVGVSKGCEAVFGK